MILFADCKGDCRWWIGLNDKATEGTFVWLSNGQAVTNGSYSPWQSGEGGVKTNTPATTTTPAIIRDCVAIDRQGVWHECKGCHKLYKYLCEEDN